MQLVLDLGAEGLHGRLVSGTRPIGEIPTLESHPHIVMARECECGPPRHKAGELFGTTGQGGGGMGCSGYGCGTIFKLAPDGRETVLYAFTGGNDGANPAGGLKKDGAGNLYGTTYVGGGGGCRAGCGVVFKLTR